MTTPDPPPLRDRLARRRTDLAAERTALANERTLLAYVRTALALLAGGVALLQFVDAPWAVVTGWAALPLAAATLAVGGWRFRSVRRSVRG